MKPKNFLPWEKFVKTIPKKRSGAGVILKEELEISISLKNLLAVYYGKKNGADEYYQDGDEILEAKFVALDKVKDFVGLDRAKRMKIYEKVFREGKNGFYR